MGQTAEELLNSLTDEQIAAYTVDPANEEHIVVGADRFIIVPESLKRIAVQFDHDIETVTFDCPRYWDGHDMSEMKVYVNYMRADGVLGMYWAETVTIDETDSNIMHFDWTISREATLVEGALTFLVCTKKTDQEGTESNHWNSELNTEMYVSKGLECAEVAISNYPEIITQLLTRMDYVEEIATPENMQNYVNDYLDKNPETPDTIRNYLYEYMYTHYPTTYEAMQEYISIYLDEHPPLLVIGPEKPGVKCVWFNTSDTQADSSSTYKFLANDPREAMYARVVDEDKDIFDFDIV